MPRARQALARSRTGLTVPSTFDTCTMAASLTDGVNISMKRLAISSPAGVIGATLSRAPVRSHTICHGTMLHRRNQDLVAGLEPGHGETVGDRVDRLGRAAGQHDLVARRRVDEARELVARRFIGARGFLA